MSLPIPGKPEEPTARSAAPRTFDLGEVSFLAVPRGPTGAVDPEVYEAWKKHIVGGFDQNREMFRQLLDAFMRPYWLTVWMYRVMFLLGILGFVAAAVLGVARGIGFAVVFGGLSVGTFLTYFVSQPLRSLEQNIQFITWLGIIYNNYWTRLMYANDPRTIQRDLDEIVKTAIQEITELVNKHAEATGRRLQPPTGG